MFGIFWTFWASCCNNQLWWWCIFLVNMCWSLRYLLCFAQRRPISGHFPCSAFLNRFFYLVARINCDVLFLLSMILILQIPPPLFFALLPISGPFSELCSLFALFSRGVCHLMSTPCVCMLLCPIWLLEYEYWVYSTSSNGCAEMYVSAPARRSALAT